MAAFGTKVSSNMNPVVGETITITIQTYANVTTTNFEVADTIPAGLTYAGNLSTSSGIANFTGTQVFVVGPGGPPNTVVTVIFNAIVTSVGNITNTANIGWGQAGQPTLDISPSVTIISTNVVCIHPDMEVTLSNGTTKTIKDVKTGDILKGSDGKKVKILINHRNTIKSPKLIKIGKFSISKTTPTKDLVLTSNHPVVMNKRYVKPQQLLHITGVKKIKGDVYTHTLITENGKPIMIYGMEVSTWKIDNWN